MTSSSDTPASEFVRVGVKGRRGHILLDRGKALNALDLPMIRAIRGALESFAADDRVEFVTIASSRPGVFCAGGDIRAVRAASLAGRYEANEAFFAEEFALNRRIAEYPKPYVALIDGVCMGGGMGLSIHGSHRVATPNLEMAMPETAIGYFPDVGASYFLNRLPGSLGLYLALTGERVGAADALACGLATHVVAADDLDAISARLDTIGVGELDPLLEGLAAEPMEEARLPARQEAIDRCLSVASIDGIRCCLAREVDSWAEEALAMLDRMSPTSLGVTTALLQRTRELPLAECLDIELRLTRIVTRSHDFLEGVRALLVDKDRQPRWSPLDQGIITRAAQE